MNSEDVTLGALDRRLEGAFNNRVQRVVFVIGGADLQFREVAEVIEISAMHADYVALVTPTVEHAVGSQLGECLDPNIKSSRIVM